jgi:HD-like signal output (HDOD) protein
VTDCAQDALTTLAPGAPDCSMAVERLLLAMERMPAQPSIALRVVWACDDPRSDSRSIADAMALDPVLVARVLRMANSAFYGVRSEVTNVNRAVTVVGLATIRAVATAAAAVTEGAVPPGFWEHAAAVATGAQLSAHLFGVPANDAFAAGLLHDLGSAILHIAVPTGWQEVAVLGGGEMAERSVFGFSHEEAAFRVMTAWRLPEALCEAAGTHTHDLASAESPMTRAVIASEHLAGVAGLQSCVHSFMRELPGLDAAGFDRLAVRVKAESESLAAVLSMG